jgi:hypothetical protein
MNKTEMTAMKCSLRFAGLGVVLATLTVMTSGRVTNALWQKSSYLPARDPRLSFASSAQKNDLLVCYDEECKGSVRTKARAYWLFSYNQNDTNVLTRPKPEFVNASTCSNLVPVLMLDGRAATTQIPTNSYCVLIGTNQFSFTLCRKSAVLGTYNLPAYSKAPFTPFWRVAVTPAAVAADTAIVATVVAAALSSSTEPFMTHN